jgi:hypothetical protein
MILKTFSPKKFDKRLAQFVQNTASFAKFASRQCFFRKNVICALQNG